MEKTKVVTEALVVPGERFDIAAGPFEEGEIFEMESLTYNRVTFLKPKRVTYETVKVGAKKTSVANIPNALRKIEPLAAPDAAATRKIKFSVAPSLKNGVNFLVNGQLHSMDAPVKKDELQLSATLTKLYSFSQRPENSGKAEGNSAAS